MMLKRTPSIENWILVGFLVFGFFGILQHEMWRDEMQAWLLARDSASVLDLFHVMQYEGHPALWHLCLYGISQMTQQVFFVQVFHFLISLGIVYIIVRHSPFLPLQKFFLSFSYFIFFEYTFVSRNYNLGVLFLLLFCVAYYRPKPRYILLAALLALAANTNVYAFMVSIALALFWLLDVFRQVNVRQIPHKQIAITGIVLGAGWGLSALKLLRVMLPQLTGNFLSIDVRPDVLVSSSTLQMIPNISSRSLSASDLVANVARTLTDIWKSYAPISSFSDVHFWNTNLLTANDEVFSFFGIAVGDYLALGLAIAMLGITTYILSRNFPVLCMYVVGNAILFIFRLGIHDDAFNRHIGHFFILFIMSLWLSNAHLSKPPNISKRPSKIFSKITTENDRFLLQRRFLTLVLAVQFLAGIHAAGMDYLYPFSTGKLAAAYLRDHNLSEMEIFGSRYRQASLLSGYLNKPIYYPEYGEFGSFWTTRAPEIEDEGELLDAIRTKLDRTEGQTLVLALTDPLESLNAMDMTIDELIQFESSIVSSETFYLYLAQGNTVHSRQ
ncbi:hypothetical protein [Vacuolonema iberomarrocanum]|uniref:hypothetical protein n=1 Tax=Vacuolonema iberomarrocanum TaxID=3454632 RepID=UPI001A0BB780|nr:hypothetical protein [filamentous cyanobacterium LEGE 07170]